MGRYTINSDFHTQGLLSGTGVVQELFSRLKHKRQKYNGNLQSKFSRIDMCSFRFDNYNNRNTSAFPKNSKV